MLSSASASGAHPVAAVATMDRIIRSVESDSLQRDIMETVHTASELAANWIETQLVF